MKEHVIPPPALQRLIKITDGSEVLIRPLCYEDKEAFLAMFNRLTAETKFLRYHYSKLTMTAEEAEEYCSLDYWDKFALVAEINRGDHKDIIGLGRYDKISPTSMAEISFLVDDREQGKGICTSLLKDLTEFARERGITKFIGELTNENTIMLDILRKYRPDLEQIVDGNDIVTKFDL